jgi:thermitase
MKRFFFIIFVIACLSTCVAKTTEGEYLVKLDNSKSLRFFNFFKAKSLARELKQSWRNLNLHHVKLGNRDLVDFKNQLKTEIEYIEPNSIVRAFTTEEETTYQSKYQWGLDAIEVSKAWKVSKGENTLVAIIDTGIDCEHIALKGRCESGSDFTDSKNGKDENGHGTHCAGIVGANGILKGVAPKANLLGIKFLDSEGAGDLASSINAIEFAIEKGAKILSCSWGGYEYSQAIFDVINKAREENVLFIFASGNESNDNDKTKSYPASYDLDNIISVGAIDKNINLASFSNYGMSVHIAAPGVKIFSTYPNDQYISLSGTSMATPFVAGVLALIKSINPEISYVDLKDRVLKNSIQVEKLLDLILSGNVLNANLD